MPHKSDDDFYDNGCSEYSFVDSDQGSEDESRGNKRGTPQYRDYGAAGYSSSSRARDEEAERSRAAITRTKRPSHANYT
eukprot:5345038-Pleurochrysis_carterae.AAC.1